MSRHRPTEPPLTTDAANAPTASLPGFGTPAPRAAAVAVGSTYTDPTEIGRGGMGRILRVTDPRLGREVALKELINLSPAARARFEREARITARLEHPSIVPVHEVGVDAAGTPYYAMRLITGRTLAAAIRDARDLPARLALLRHVGAVADAIAYAHSRRIVHRDLKASNVVLGEFGETVVIDWGIAKDLAAGGDDDAPDAGPYRHGAGDRDLTEAGAILGTPAYMPPEQAEGDAVDERADVYALGVMLYHLVAGEMPYQGSTGESVLLAVLAGPPPPITTRVPDGPRDLAAIIDKAMARDRAARYPSARELAAELARFQAGQLVGAHRYSTGELVGRWVRRHRAAVAVASIALVTAAVGGAAAIQRVVAARDRAEAARVDADAARAEAVARADEAILHRARDLVDDDPRAALETLLRLSDRSPHWPAGRVIAADAAARGVSVVVGELGAAPVDLAVRPDGTVIALGTDQVLRAPPGGPPAVTALRAPVVARDGTLAWIDDDGRRAWVERDGTAAAVGVPDGAKRLALTNDGTALAVVTAGPGATVHLIDLPGGATRALGAAPTCRFDPMAHFTQDEARLIVLCPNPATARIWDRDGRQVVLPGVRSLARSPGGRWEVVDRADGTVLRDTRGGPSRSLGTFGFSPGIFFLRGERWVLVHPHFERDLRVLDLERGEDHILRADESSFSLDITPDQTTLATTTESGSLHLWDLAALPSGDVPRFGGPSFERPPLRVAGASIVAFAPDGDLLTVDDRGQLLRWRRAHHATVARDGQELAADLRHELVVHRDHLIHQEVGGANPRRLDGVDALPLHDPPGVRAAIGDDGVVAAAAGDAILLWNPASGATERIATGAAIVAVASAGGTVVVVTADRRLLAVRAGEPARELGRTSRDATYPQLSNDGRHLVLRGDPQMRVIRVADAVELALPVGSWIGFSPDGRAVVLSGDALVRCDLATVACVPLPDSANPGAATIGADGAIVATRDGRELVLWPAGEGAPRLLGSHRDNVAQLAFSADSATLISAGDGPEARIWDLASGESRLVTGLRAMPVAVRHEGDRIRIADWFSTHELADDAPRDEAALRRWIAGWLAGAAR